MVVFIYVIWRYVSTVHTKPMQVCVFQYNVLENMEAYKHLCTQQMETEFTQMWIFQKEFQSCQGFKVEQSAQL